MPEKTYTQAEVDKIIADTIEACAKVCDEVLGDNDVSAAIRARGDE